jgi:hypothetical protein
MKLKLGGSIRFVQTQRSAAFIQLDPVTGSARKRQSIPFGGQKVFRAR